MLYQVYCAKLTEEGSDYSSETSLRKFIKESKEKRQEETLSFNSSKKSRQKAWYGDSDNELVKWILGGFVGIVVFIYYIVLYFTVFDTTEQDEKSIHR